MVSAHYRLRIEEHYRPAPLAEEFYKIALVATMHSSNLPLLSDVHLAFELL